MKQMLETYRASQKAVKERAMVLRRLYTQTNSQIDAVTLQRRIQILEDEARELRAVIAILENYLRREQI